MALSPTFVKVQNPCVLYVYAYVYYRKIVLKIEVQVKCNGNLRKNYSNNDVRKKIGFELMSNREGSEEAELVT
jgi:hypothetical protein